MLTSSERLLSTQGERLYTNVPTRGLIHRDGHLRAGNRVCRRSDHQRHGDKCRHVENYSVKEMREKFAVRYQETSNIDYEFLIAQEVLTDTDGSQ
jgi:hypothetical protein